MLKRGLNHVCKGALGALAASLCLMAPLSGGTEVAAPVLETSLGWQEFHAVAGGCSMLFPATPEHVSEKLAMPDEGYELKYDAYISSVDQKSIFMLLVAKYPDFVDEAYAKMSLEGFLNGILTYNPSNQLIFADLLLVDGHEAVDFFIRSGGLYFKGRAIMIKNSLYLMAMECEIPHYNETHFNNFVNSFKMTEAKK